MSKKPYSLLDDPKALRAIRRMCPKPGDKDGFTSIAFESGGKSATLTPASLPKIDARLKALKGIDNG